MLPAETIDTKRRRTLNAIGKAPNSGEPELASEHCEVGIAQASSPLINRGNHSGLALAVPAV